MLYYIISSNDIVLQWFLVVMFGWFELTFTEKCNVYRSIPNGKHLPGTYTYTHIYIYMYIFLRVHINIWATTMYVNCFRSHSMIWFYSPITTNIFPRSMVCLVLWLKEQIIYRENAYFQYYITIYYSWLGHIWWWTNLVSGCFWLIFRHTNNRKMLCIKSLLAQFVRKSCIFSDVVPFNHPSLKHLSTH